MKKVLEEESSYLKYWDVNNLYGWAMLQMFPGNKFEWTKNTSQFNENFIKNYDRESDERYFAEVDFQYPENLYELIIIYYFYQKVWKMKKCVTNLHDKTL